MRLKSDENKRKTQQDACFNLWYNNPTFLLPLSRHSEPKAKNLDGVDTEALRFAQGDG